MENSCRLTIVAAFIAAATITGCGPSLKSTINVPRVEFAQDSKTKGSLAGTQLTIDNFVDKRVSKVIAGSTPAPEEKGTESAQPVGPAVQDGLKRAFADRGAESTESAPIVVTGEVLRWYAGVTSGFASQAKGEAAIRIEVYDPANKKIYTGTYEGYATKQHPSLSERDVSETLGAAMAQALSQVVEDKQLVKVLSAY